MSGARLTDAELDEAMRIAEQMHSVYFVALVSEVRERRMAARINDETILDDNDVTRIFKIKPGTLKSMRSRGQIPFVRLGGGHMIRYRREDLERWFANETRRKR